MVRKKKISVTLDPAVVGELSDRIGETYDNRSEAVESLLKDALSADERQAEYEERIAELETENERLQRRVETLIAKHEEHGELVEYVEREKSLQERREERETERAARRNAPIWKRGYWWVFGRDEQDALRSEG
jgi:metal-responsive CopG/Arc/MetJ family transcriptional regulator